MEIGVVIVIFFAILLTLIKWTLIIMGIVWLVRYLKESREERKRFRLELGKLAEEVHLIRGKFGAGQEESKKQSG